MQKKIINYFDYLIVHYDYNLYKNIVYESFEYCYLKIY